MMLWPVELYAARNPGTCEPDQSRFDYILAIEKIVAICLVESDVNAPANLGQNHQPEILVLDVSGLPLTRLSALFDSLDTRQRIYSSAAALVHPALQKHW